MKHSTWITMFSATVLAFSALAQEQEIGTEQESHDSRLFLRMSTILLKPGQKSIGVSVKYASNEQNRPALTQTTTQVNLTTTLRLALSKRIEISATVPFAWKQRERDNYANITRETDDATGLGDISLGAKFLLFNEQVSSPEIVASLGVGIPTSDNHYSNDVAIGIGHYSASLEVTAIKSIEPATFFGGLSYTHYLNREFGGRNVKRDGAFGYNFGAGFALNHRLTLGSQVMGSVAGELEVDSKVVPFSDQAPVLLKNSLTYLWDRETTIEPSITFGLNNDAPDTVFGFSLHRRF